MTRHARRLTGARTAIVGAGLLLLAAGAAAESRELAATTPGYLTETAGFVLLARAPDAPPEPGTSWTFEVTEVLRSPAPPGATVDVHLAEDRTVEAGLTYVLFLRSEKDEGRGFALLDPDLALRVADAAAVAPLVDYVRNYAAFLDRDGRVRQGAADGFRDLLVKSLASAHGGVAFAAGFDLCRHEELHGAVSDAQRRQIADALAVPRRGDLDLAAVIEAAGRLGGPDVDLPLVERLLDPGTRNLRRYTTRALGRRASAELVETLSSRLDGATSDARADIASALAKMKHRAAGPTLVTLLRDGESAVRVEAAHGIGLLAREVRRPPTAEELAERPELAEAERPNLTIARGPLLEALATAGTRNERRATLWALAQIDTAEAWASLRRIAEDHEDVDVRRIAAAYLERPRVALLLD